MVPTSIQDKFVMCAMKMKLHKIEELNMVNILSFELAFFGKSVCLLE